VHNNYYFLRHFSHELEKVLTRTVISESFSQNKDELIIRFETHSEPVFIKASLLPSFSCLSISDKFSRARKNSVNLFDKLIGQRVQGIRQFNNERSFALLLSNTLSLLFKMHGNRANILLLENEEVQEIFKKNIQADAQLNIHELDREIDWSFENFEKHRLILPSQYFTFGKIIWKYLESIDFQKKDTQEQWNIIQAIREELDKKNFYLTEINGIPTLSVLKVGNVIKQYTSAIQAINDFYYTFTQVFAFQREKASALSSLKAKLQQSQNYYDKMLAKLNELTANNNYKSWADLIMANLHTIKPLSEKATLENFYNNNQPIEIKLKKDFSPQKNAELYYRKSKNQQVEINRLRQALNQKETEILEITFNLENVEKSTELSPLRKLVASLSLDQDHTQQAALLPYHEFFCNTFKIWVGRNAQNNDILTFKLGYKEDLWLHAKDVAGSHVLIKYQSGKNFPKDVIERAAQLAAYNSKRKNETLCPVIVTPKKYVRKRKGDPAGAVVVDREEVIMVEPKLD
jgi:predicted ribosome quality control (RQC) complex YloA/Tae2 family protein